MSVLYFIKYQAITTTIYLPFSIPAILAHLLPWILWNSNILRSSSLLIGSLLIFGSRWLCQRSLHCLALRLLIPYFCFTIFATFFHSRVPYSLTNVIIALSSYTKLIRKQVKLLTSVSQWFLFAPLEFLLSMFLSSSEFQISDSFSVHGSVRKQSLPESSLEFSDIIILIFVHLYFEFILLNKFLIKIVICIYKKIILYPIKYYFMISESYTFIVQLKKLVKFILN